VLKKSYLLFLFLFISALFSGNLWAEDKVNLKFFHSPSCKACLNIKQEYLPDVVSKYKGKIDIEYFDVSNADNLKVYVALGEKLNKKVRVPLIIIGKNVLIGSVQIKKYLEPLIEKYISGELSMDEEMPLERIDLWQKFRSFSFLTIVAAGLIDGINPCAFTVLVFFLSFLTLMGYKYKELLAIGLAFILAVFLTYLAIGLGLFKGLYAIRQFYIFVKIIYYATAGICFILAYLNLYDFMEYRKTGRTDSLKVKLPQAVRQRINSIISVFYRPGAKDKVKTKLALVLGTFVVGFLVSLLEAVCTGQVYLPVIVFILKDQQLRLKAISYLLLYNFMFIVPLLLILAAALLGIGSKKLEEFFRNKIAVVKFVMFCLFFFLGMILILS
jgi:cytochrome c biogenesis protein CcdA